MCTSIITEWTWWEVLNYGDAAGNNHILEPAMFVTQLMSQNQWCNILSQNNLLSPAPVASSALSISFSIRRDRWGPKYFIYIYTHIQYFIFTVFVFIFSI